MRAWNGAECFDGHTLALMVDGVDLMYCQPVEPGPEADGTPNEALTDEEHGEWFRLIDAAPRMREVLKRVEREIPWGRIPAVEHADLYGEIRKVLLMLNEEEI